MRTSDNGRVRRIVCHGFCSNLTILRYNCTLSANIKLNQPIVFISGEHAVPHWLGIVNGFLVSKETVVLCQWESGTKIWFYQTS